MMIFSTPSKDSSQHYSEGTTLKGSKHAADAPDEKTQRSPHARSSTKREAAGGTDHPLETPFQTAPVSPRGETVPSAPTGCGHAQDSLALKNVWRSIKADSCPYRYNFHMHTSCSDGQLSPQALIEQAATIGLQGLAITDHHSVCGFIAAQNWLKAAGMSPHLWSGVEITANLEGTEVHLLGYAFDPNGPTLAPYLQGARPQGEAARAARVIAAIHEAGGLAVLAHPSRYSQSATCLVPAAARLGIDGIEAYYAYGNPKPWQPSRQQTQLALRLAQEYGLLTTCGTDTHGSSLLRRI